jgi:hypothetical protein
MAKFEQIDRLIDQAVEDSPTAQQTRSAGTVTVKEQSREPAAAALLQADRIEVSPAAEPAEKSTNGLLASKPTQAERTRQILGALRPFLPVVGGALRLIDHGAAQAASRLLPLLAGGSLGAPGAKTAESAAALEALAALDKERATMQADLALCQEQLRSHEERLMKLREALTRTLADHDAMQRSLRQLTDRNRLLTAGMVILLMVVVAAIVLMQMNVHI